MTDRLKKKTVFKTDEDYIGKRIAYLYNDTVDHVSKAIGRLDAITEESFIIDGISFPKSSRVRIEPLGVRKYD